jgi:catechol 2,3-dioxygenase-like lactoylglutathione lyase family enzyme
MTTVVSRLLTRYERGTVTRRELIAALVALAAGTPTEAAAGVKVSRIDHISLQVSDLQRSREFYANIFTASVNRNPRPDNELRLDLGDNANVVLRRAGEPGQVNHLGVRVDGFDRASVAQQLRRAGITPVDEPNLPGTVGFHVVDPDGFRVQLL